MSLSSSAVETASNRAARRFERLMATSPPAMSENPVGPVAAGGDRGRLTVGGQSSANPAWWVDRL